MGPDAMDFSAAITLHAGRAHVAVTGDVDVVTTLQVRWRLDDALAQGCTRFTVDVAGLTFIDAAGLDAFVRLHNATTQLGGTVTFVATSPAFRRVCGLTGLTEAFRLSGLSTPVAYDMA
jgi:anti-anti-sigma factor